jgi:hypothetical protein
MGPGVPPPRSTIRHGLVMIGLTGAEELHCDAERNLVRHEYDLTFPFSPGSRAIFELTIPANDK